MAQAGREPLPPPPPPLVQQQQQHEHAVKKPRCLVPHNATPAMLALVELAAGCGPGVLGPARGLGTVERGDEVAVALDRLLPEVCILVVAGNASKREAVARMQNWHDDALDDFDGALLDLANPLAYSEVGPPTDEETDGNHPQLLLHKSKLIDRFQGVLNMDVSHDSGSGSQQVAQPGGPAGRVGGFVGFAVNLVVLPDDLLEYRVSQSGGCFTLRQTLWHHVLGNAMVLEREADVRALTDRCTQEGISLEDVKLISLDGYGYNVLGPGNATSYPIASAEEVAGLHRGTPAL